MTVCVLLAERLVCRNENWHCLRANPCYIKTWTVDSIFQPIRWNQDQSENKSSGVIEEKQGLLNNLGSNLGWELHGRWKSRTKENGNELQRGLCLFCLAEMYVCHVWLFQERNDKFFVYCFKIMRPFKY